MDFNFSAEQDMLRESVSRYLGDRYDFAQRQAMLRSESAGAHRSGAGSLTISGCSRTRASFGVMCAAPSSR